MQPSNTPAISKYIVRATLSGGVWTFNEIFNSTGKTIETTRSGTTFLITAEDPAFSTTKTLVLISPSKVSGIQYLVTSMTTTVVTIDYNQTNPDSITIQVETINI